MPTPDGREWASRRRIAVRLGTTLVNDERLPVELRQYLLDHRAAALNILEEAIDDFNLSYEFKILRLVEKVKDAIESGVFGPLTIPNTVDENGEKIKTPVGEIGFLLKDCYTPEFLDQFDEDGNPLSGGS